MPDAHGESRFWRFSLRFYAMPAVAPACLRLQDEAQVDVNIALFLLWQALAHRSVSEQEIRAIDHAVRSWRDEVVRPLRRVRRVLKIHSTSAREGDAMALRSEVKRSELQAEKLEQQMLAGFGGSTGRREAGPAEAAAASLASYEAVLGTKFPDTALRDLLAAFAEGRHALTENAPEEIG